MTIAYTEESRVNTGHRVQEEKHCESGSKVEDKLRKSSTYGCEVLTGGLLYIKYLLVRCSSVAIRANVFPCCRTTLCYLPPTLVSHVKHLACRPCPCGRQIIISSSSNSSSPTRPFRPNVYNYDYRVKSLVSFASRLLDWK
jgi:hypothetical protein